MRTLRAVLFAALTTVFFSVSAVSATRTAHLIGGTEANFWRLSMATVFLAVLAHVFGQGHGGSVFHIFLVSGVVGFGVGDVALFQALPRIGSRLTVMLVHCLTAPIAAVAEWLWLGTVISPAEIACAVVILAGVALALAPREHLHIPRREFWWGIHFAVWAAIGQAGGVVLSRKAYALTVLAGEPMDGITAAYQRIIAGTIVAGFCLLLVKRQYLAGWTNPMEEPAKPDGKLKGWEKWRKATGWLVLNAFSGPTFGVSCYQWALKTTPAGIVLPIVALSPLVVIPMALVMEKEKPSRRSLAGGVIAVGGAVLLAWLSTR